MADTRFKKGMVPWNKKKHIEKVCKCGKIFYVKPSLDRVKSCSISCGQKGKKSSELQKISARIQVKKLAKFRKGVAPWNKGLKGYLAGDKHYNWQGGKYTENYRERRRFRDQLQKTVFERDSYTCQLCSEKGGCLQVDHIQPWAEYIELRFSIDNCRTLCASCHYKITYGKPMPAEVKAWGHNLKRRALT